METTEQEIIAGLDLGATQFRVVIGKRCEEGIEIIGAGQSPSQGMRKGEVVNPEHAATAISKAVNDAESMAGCKVSNTVVGIAGMSIHSQISSAAVQVKQGRVSDPDILGVLNSARSVRLPSGREILHVIPFEYVIDRQIKTTHPLGFTGSTLEVKANIITVESSGIKNIIKTCRTAGLNGFDIVLQSPATAETLLLPEELEHGVVHIEIGGGSARISVYSGGSLWFYARLWLSGNKLTEDVAVGLRISMLQAEQVKILHGCCLENMEDNNYEFEVLPYKDKGRRLISRNILAQIIGGRVGEFFRLIAEELQKNGHNLGQIPGAVISGSTSLLTGIKDLAEEVFDIPVRIGSPGAIRGVLDMVSQPHYSTAVGLVLYGAKSHGVSQGIRVEKGNRLLFRVVQSIGRVLCKCRIKAP